LFRFSISNAFRRKWVLVIAIIGVGLGFALMTVLLSISDGMNQRMNETMNKMAGTIIVTPPGAFYSGASVKPLPDYYVGDIENIDHVKAACPYVTAIFEAPESPMGYWALYGVDTEKDIAIDGPNACILPGGHPVNGDNQVIMGEVARDYVRQYHHHVYNIGDIVKAIPVSS
jgi:putative ABC transport system permease protein